MKIVKNIKEMYPVFKKILDKNDHEALHRSTNYATNYIRQVLNGYTEVTERNKVIIDHAIELSNQKLRKLQKIIGHAVE
jgi:hypothetical protein